MQPKIYISYSWSPESKAVVDEIDEDWKAVGITLTRDTRDVGYKQSIRDFMQSMKSGDYVLLVISKGYLESKNCMYEALDLLQDPAFKDKILPIIAPDANIHSALGKMAYLQHWDAKIKELRTALRRYGSSENMQEIHAELDHFLKIRASISSFSGVLSDMRSATWPDIKKQNYKEIFDHIGYEDSGLLEECRRILTLGNEEEQELALDELIENYPNNRFVLFTQSSVAQEAKKYKKARRILERLLPIDPFLSLHTLGILLAEHLNEPQLARENLEKFLALQPDDANAHYNLALLLTNELQEHGLARQHYEQALTLQPDDAGTHHNLALLLTNKFDEHGLARQHYEQALVLRPDDASTHHNLALLLTDKFDEHGLARQHYEQALALRPDDASTHHNLAVLLTSQLQEHELARQHYEQALVLRPDDASTHHNLAVLLTDKFDEHGLARQHYEQALALQPDDANAHYNLAVLLTNKFDEHGLARQHYEQALALQPDDADTHHNLAVLLTRDLQEYELARKHYEQALALQPDDASTHHNLAVLLTSQLQEHELARQHYEQALALRPNHASTHYNLALLLNYSQEDFLAKKHYKTALELDASLYNVEMDSLFNQK